MLSFALDALRRLNLKEKITQQVGVDQKRNKKGWFAGESVAIKAKTKFAPKISHLYDQT